MDVFGTYLDGDGRRELEALRADLRRAVEDRAKLLKVLKAVEVYVGHGEGNSPNGLRYISALELMRKTIGDVEGTL